MGKHYGVRTLRTCELVYIHVTVFVCVMVYRGVPCMINNLLVNLDWADSGGDSDGDGGGDGDDDGGSGDGAGWGRVGWLAEVQAHIDIIC